MPKRKIINKNVRKLTKLGGQSIAVVLPIQEVRRLGWRERQKVVIKRAGEKLIISDWKK